MSEARARAVAGRLAAAVAIYAALALGPAETAHSADGSAPAVDVANGAWELGFNGSVVSREGAVNSTIAVFSNRFWARGATALSAGAVVAYSRVSDLDRVDLEAQAAVYRRLRGSSAYGYAGIGGGLRQEWVGSFSQARYPVGVDVGIKALISRRAAVTVTYQFRHLLNDPVAGFNEHRFVTGISIFFNNTRK
jgi:hypothetical protein